MARRTEEEFTRDLTALLITEGISSLTIADIATRLKCSKRRIYQIAPTKEALFLGVCKTVLAENLARGHARAQEETEPAKEINVYLQATLNASGMKKACLVDLDATSEGRKLFDDYQLARIRGLEAIIEKGVRQNVFVSINARLVSEAILGAAHRLRNQALLEEMGVNIGEAFKEFYHLVLHGLLKAD